MQVLYHGKVVGTSQKWPAKAGGRSPKGPALVGTTVVPGRYTLCNIALANMTKHNTRVETSYSPQIYEYSGIWKYSNLINFDACFAMGTEHCIAAAGGV